MTTDEELGEALASWQSAEGGPTLAQVKAHRRSRSTPTVAIAMAASVLLALGGSMWMSDGAQRDKGVGGLPDGAVQLDVFVDGPELVLAGPDGVMGAKDRAVFRVRTSSPGSLTLLEEMDGAWVVVDQWPVGVGVHTVGGDTPQSWRPDREGTHARYRAVLCEGGGTDGGEVPAGCVFDERRVVWSY